MASQYSFHDGMGEVVPWNARYAYPSQASRTWKTNIKLPAKNGNTFNSLNNANGTPIVFEFPAQSYANMRNTCLSFDFKLNASAANSNARVQNNIQSIFKRVRLMYGSLPLEDIREYNVIMRMITEAINQNTNGVSSQASIGEGIGGIRPYILTASGDTTVYLGNVRLLDIQSSQPVYTGMGIKDGWRRYTVQLGLGLFQQLKLLPLKWMASQLRVEIELAPYAECITAEKYTAGTDYYELQNMTFEVELLEFDGAYDTAFLEGLRGDGVPIKFSSWDTFLYSTISSQSQTLLVPERNRSLKGLHAVQLPPRRVNRGNSTTASPAWDSHAFLESSTGIDTGTTTGNIKDFQWRIGGKYFPAQPVLCANGTAGNGAAEAYFEFAKAVNLVGHYSHGTALNSNRWSRTNASSCIDWSGGSTAFDTQTGANSDSFQFGPTCFVMSADLETSDGTEVSGLNGEEQNDIALMANFTTLQDPTCFLDIFCYYDALLVLRENNIVELIK